MPRNVQYLVILILLLAACSPEPKELTPSFSGFSISVDPISQSVILKEGSFARLAPQQTGEPRVLSSQELTLFTYYYRFSPGNRLQLFARFKNNTQNLDMRQPFTFHVAPETTNIVGSIEPTVTNDDLGGDDTLSPGEITGTKLTVNDPDTYLVFEVEHKNEPFTYFVDASANVSETRLIWPVQFGSDSGDSATGSATDPEGNVYVSGYTSGSLPGATSVGGRDAFLAKYASDSNLLWIRQFGTAVFDEAWDVATDASGNVYVSGHTDGSFPGTTSAGDLDAFVAKYASDGSLIWIKQFGSAGTEEVRDVATDASGNVYVSGRTRGNLPGNTSSGGPDAFLTKYASDGSLLWIKQFGSNDFDAAFGVATDPAGKIYVSGRTDGSLPGNTGAGSSDVFLTKFASDGSILWIRQFGSSSIDEAQGVATDTSGNVYLSGFTWSSLPGTTSAGGVDAFVARYDADGNQLWIKQFGSDAGDSARDVATDTSGNVYVSGGTSGSLPDNTSAGSSDAFVARYDADGNQLWIKQFGSDAGDSANEVATDQDGNVYVIGDTDGSLPGNTGAGGRDVFLTKYASDGTSQ